MYTDSRANERRAMENEKKQTSVKAEELAQIVATKLSPSELDVVYAFALGLSAKAQPNGKQPAGVN